MCVLSCWWQLLLCTVKEFLQDDARLVSIQCSTAHKWRSRHATTLLFMKWLHRQGCATYHNASAIDQVFETRKLGNAWCSQNANLKTQWFWLYETPNVWKYSCKDAYSFIVHFLYIYLLIIKPYSIEVTNILNNNIVLYVFFVRQWQTYYVLSLLFVVGYVLDYDSIFSLIWYNIYFVINYRTYIIVYSYTNISVNYTFQNNIYYVMKSLLVNLTIFEINK